MSMTMPARDRTDQNPYPRPGLRIGASWQAGEADATHVVRNPASGAVLARFAGATAAQLDEAVAAAAVGFSSWRESDPVARSQILARAADLLRERAAAIGGVLTLEQGKPLAEAVAEVRAAADLLTWFGEEARRGYGRVIPARAPGILQLSLREPVGIVAAFTPWNFPLSQIARKVGPALATGCTMVLKAPEETPGAPGLFVQALLDAGLPDGVLNLVFGVPAEISRHLVAHPAVRKLSFTGSVPVGKALAALAGQHMKRATMELGGHGAALIFADADIEAAAAALAGSKYRNAGQVCVSPTRFLIERPAYERFVARFVEAATRLRVGDGLDPETKMGPLANERRREAIESLVDEARGQGAELLAGGTRADRNQGYFCAPTVLAGLTPGMRAMREEPFGPLALMLPFDDADAALAEANRLPYGLACYAWTRSQVTADRLSRRLETGMLTINHLGLGLPELPFGGVKESGYGSEGGIEAAEAYLVPKLVTHAFN